MIKDWNDSWTAELLWENTRQYKPSFQKWVPVEKDTTKDDVRSWTTAVATKKRKKQQFMMQLADVEQHI